MFSLLQFKTTLLIRAPFSLNAVSNTSVLQFSAGPMSLTNNNPLQLALEVTLPSAIFATDAALSPKLVVIAQTLSGCPESQFYTALPAQKPQARTLLASSPKQPSPSQEEEDSRPVPVTRSRIRQASPASVTRMAVRLQCPGRTKHPSSTYSAP